MSPARSLLPVMLLLVAVSAAADPGEFPSGSSASPAIPLGRALAQREAGETIRVATADGRSLEGVFAGADGRTLSLLQDGREVRVPLADVRALAVRGRATGWGAKRGAVVGGVLLGAYGVLLGSVVSADDDGWVPALAAVGVGSGILIGGTAGGLIGAAFPRWRAVWGEDVPAEGAPPAALDAGGGLALGGGYAEALGGRDPGGAAWQAQLRIRAAGGLTHGLEFLYAKPGEARKGWLDAPPGQPAVEHQASLVQLGWRLEVPLRRPGPGRVLPFVSGGLAAYWWQDAYAGYNLGGGLRLDPAAGRPGLLLEARRHDNLQNLTETDPAHWTAVALLTWDW